MENSAGTPDSGTAPAENPPALRAAPFAKGGFLVPPFAKGGTGGIYSSMTHLGNLYDIHPGKPHHRHVRGREEPYLFTTPEQLWDDFVTDVEAVLRGEL